MSANKIQNGADTATQSSSPEVAPARTFLNASDLEHQAAKAEDHIGTALQEVDELAIRLHLRYRRLALITATTGTLAVLLAILQLFVSERYESIRSCFSIVEAVSAFVAVTFVIYGMRTFVHHRWILKRHQAERLRALQAEYLIRLLAVPLTEERFTTNIAAVTSIDSQKLKNWLLLDLVPVPPEALIPARNATEILPRFRELYTELRLKDQSEYLKKAGARHDRLDHATRHVPPFLFFASIACVGLHSGFHLLHGEMSAQVAHVFLMLAACLPVVATGLRTYREAVQGSRNAARFASKAAALNVLRQELDSATAPEKALEVAWHSEQVLESEHREWLRLMLEAEWFA